MISVTFAAPTSILIGPGKYIQAVWVEGEDAAQDATAPGWAGPMVSMTVHRLGEWSVGRVIAIDLATPAPVIFATGSISSLADLGPTQRPA